MYRLAATIDDRDVLLTSAVTVEAASRVTSLALEVRDQRDAIVARVAEFRGCFLELATWVGDNAASLLREEPPAVLPHSGSLAARIGVFYETVDTDDVTALDAVYEYRVRHGLRFAYRGTDLPRIYMGFNGAVHEISCAEGASWSYEIDLSRFISEVTLVNRHPKGTS